MAKHTGMMASEASFAEMQVKTRSFMLFITRMTENTNLAVVMPSDEGAFNTARVNVQLAKKEFAHLDIIEKKGKDVVRAGKDGSGADEEARVSDEGEISS
jgi:Ras-related GTP-binding protein A/B